MFKLNPEKVRKSGWRADSIPSMQVAVFVMCGGGFLGKFAAEQPADFYFDDRVDKLPYSKHAILQAVETLATIAAANDLNPKQLPEMPKFHKMGVL